jgi:hypothetical protein
MAADVKIDIAAEFTGKKAFKQAETSTDKLVKTTKKLAGALGLAFGTQAIIAFGRKSVKAFADSELEATRLRTAVTNLGLAFAAPEIDRYIDKIELATGVNRDQLQPAFLTLLQTTGSLAKSQELLNLSLDVAAATGTDAASVSTKLAQAYVGNAKGLRSLNLGLTTAELNSADFELVQKRITQLFGGQGEAAAASYVAQIAKLSIASEQASEIIGKGLVDSLLILSNNTSVEELADDMLDAARNTAAFTEAVAGLANAINAPIKGLANVLTSFVKATDPFVDLIIEGDPSGFMKKKPPSSTSAPAAGFGGKTFYADAKKNAEAIAKAEATAKKRAAELLAIKKKQQALEGKILKDKKLAALIDKSNALLAKGEEVFDMDRIQIAAALTNQAEQLGNATSNAQILQIANDTARLNVKQSILALEDAIAAKDEQAIIAATNKLNADLKVLNALSGQNTQMLAIKTILESLKPVDLVNQNNLDEAIAKIQEMLRLLALAQMGAGGTLPRSGKLGSGIEDDDFIAPIDLADGLAASTDALIEASEAIQARADAFTYLLDLQTKYDTEALANSSLAQQGMAGLVNVQDVARSSLLSGLSGGAGVAGAVSGSRYAAQAAAQYNITIQANTIANPDELTNLIQNSLIDLNKRGDYLVNAGAL